MLPFVVRQRCTLAVRLAPETSSSSPRFAPVGEADLAVVRALGDLRAAGRAGPTFEHEGMALTEVDPGPALRVSVRLVRLASEALARLYPGIGTTARRSGPAPTSADIDRLGRALAVRAASEGARRTVRLGPIALATGPAHLELHAWALEAPRAQFGEDGDLEHLVLTGVAEPDFAQALANECATAKPVGWCGRWVRADEAFAA